MTKHNPNTRAERLRQQSQDRRENERQELRQLILDTAGELFAKEGYQAFSVRRIAEHIGYTPGAIYRYFDDKDDLLFNVADDGFKQFRASQQAAAMTDGGWADRLRAMARAYVAFGLEHPYTYRLMFMERPDLLFDNRRDEAEKWLNALADYQTLFTAAIAAGVLKQGDSIAMSDAWWSMLHGITALGITMGFVFDSERLNHLLEAALSMFFQGFGA